ncbi:MAG: YqgE/AlgH family protein [Gammaproteobacteria bacterium]|nr:YqgE/AlgH family protein [Gammaproteobacteria bacterium]NIR96279.1 YqgE/AlgH family protein [Gammaproteobacteria bacterium]
MIQHDDQGSAGLVVNRISRLPLESVLTEESQLSEKNKTLSYGGPVEPKTLLALVKVRNHPPEPADIVMDNVYITGVGILDGWPDYQREVVDFRAFVGYTGWAPGQLNVEMERGDWDVLPADEDNIFTARDETLWESLRDKISAAK